MIGYHARVAFNRDATLCTIPSLLESEFGIPENGNVGQCLISQVAFTIAATTGIPASTIARHILRHKTSRGTRNGFTLKEILDTFNEPVRTRKGDVTLIVTSLVYNSLESLVDAVINGFPVMVIIAREACDVIEHEAAAYHDGTVHASPIRKSSDDTYHVYLAIGADTDGFVILRDTRHTYSFHGYLRISTKILQQNFENIRAISVNVIPASVTDA